MSAGLQIRSIADDGRMKASKQARFKYRNSTNDLTNSQRTAHAISFQAMESHCDVKRNYNRKTRTSARV